MLSSILPGLRELRTPLAVGYLWLLFLYLVLTDRLPQRLSDGPVSRMDALQGLLGQGFTLTALTFIAYVLGILVGFSPFLPPLRSYPRIVHRVRRQGWRPYFYRQEVPDPLLRDAEAYVEREAARISRNNQGILASDLAEVLGVRDENTAWRTKVSTVAAVVMAEAPTLAVRLQIASENLYQSYDRKRAESEFRSAVGVPTAALIVAIGVIERWPPFFLLLIAPIALVVKGSERSRAAQAELIQVLLQGVMRSPLLERLEEVAVRSKERRDAQKTKPADDEARF